MGEVKNSQVGGSAAQAVQNLAKDPKAALGMLKSLFNDKDSKINNVMAALMAGMAVFIDGLQFLLVWAFGAGVIIDTFITLLAWGIFFIWFTVLNVNFFGTRKTATQLISFVAELIPAINMLPAVTTMVVLSVGFTRMEESGKSKVTSNTGPVNSGEIKQPKNDAGASPRSVDEGIKNKRHM